MKKRLNWKKNVKSVHQENYIELQDCKKNKQTKGDISIFHFINQSTKNVLMSNKFKTTTQQQNLKIYQYQTYIKKHY